MQVIIELPNEFKEHFENDKFQDSLKRVLYDIAFYDGSLSGRYEIELIEALQIGFNNAKEI